MTVVTQHAQRVRASLDSELRQWCGLLADILDVNVDPVGVVIHWSSAQISHGPTLPRKSLTPESLGQFQENVVYLFSTNS